MVIIAEVLLVAAGVLIIAVRDRRTMAISLGVVPLAVVLIKLEAGVNAHGVPGLLAPLIAGETAAAVLALSASGRPFSRRTFLEDAQVSREAPEDVSPFALLSAVMLALGAYYFAGQNPIIGATLTFPTFWLVGAGLYAALLAMDPFKVGTGFLLTMSGLGTAIATLGLLDPAVLGAEAVLVIVLALAAGYLAQASDTVGEGAE